MCDKRAKETPAGSNAGMHLLLMYVLIWAETTAGEVQRGGQNRTNLNSRSRLTWTSKKSALPPLGLLLGATRTQKRTGEHFRRSNK